MTAQICVQISVVSGVVPREVLVCKKNNSNSNKINNNICKVKFGACITANLTYSIVIMFGFTVTNVVLWLSSHAFLSVLSVCVPGTGTGLVRTVFLARL